MTPADWLLAASLLAGLPAHALWRSLRHPPAADPRARIARYRRSIATALVPTMLLAGIWAANGWPSAWLGLARPDRSGWILIAAMIALLGVLAIGAVRAAPRTETSRNARALALMPQGPREVLWFLAFALTAGVCWEILCRGYLYWLLQPQIGAGGAVAAMTASYGIAHGYHDARSFIGSLVSAALFATAFALTHSLWWLMLLHAGLPLFGLIAGRRRAP